MAKEISQSVKLAVVKGNLSLSRSVTQSVDMTGNGVSGGAVSVATTTGGVALPVGDVATAGQAWMRNLDATNYIEVGIQVSGTFYPFIKLLPGGVWTGQLGTNAPYARAHTAAARLEFYILEA